jgi:ligand-binding sensor domain-containing protein/serine phosphatase RsbU (regulator of sigma subunit)
MKYFKLKIVIAIFCSFFLTTILPQNHISFNHLNVEDGLSQSVVTCILQDDNGFMWFGTQDGLNRYDGYSFKVFRNDPKDPKSLKDNFIFSIYQSNEGPLYFETQQGNFHVYNPSSESFSIVNKDSVNLFNTRYSSITALYLDPKGVIWSGGGSRRIGLTREDKNTGEITTFKHDPLDYNSLSSDRVYSIFKDRAGKLWIGTYGGLDILNEETGKFTHFNNITDDRNNLSTDWVWPIYQDNKGIMWFGTVNGGLNRFDPISKSIRYYKNIATDPSSLSHNYIFSIYEDRSGVIWIGTNAGGINYFSPSKLVFEHFINDPNNSNSLTNNEVLSALVDKAGTYWIGTRNGGLNKLDFNRKIFNAITHNPQNNNSIISNSVQTLYQDSKGIIWIGTPGSGLDEYDPNKGKFTHYVSDPSNQNSLTDNRIYSLLEDKNGIIWIGTYRGGLNRLDPITRKIKSFQFDKNDSTSISSNATWSLSEDGKGNLWIGTFGGGVNVFDPIKEQFQRIQFDPNNPTSLPDNNIIRVFKDSKGNIWIGTTKGLSKYLGGYNNFKNYNSDDGLPNNFIYGIIEDGKGNLWLSTNNGLSKFDPEDETFKNYYYEDGLQGNEFNQNAFAKDLKTGKLLFGGLNGFNVFHPDSLKDNLYKPPIVLTRYLRYNTDDEEGKPIVEKGISVRDSILLTYKDNIINLEFSALSYFNNYENQYKYKLEGFNENWIQLGNNRTVTFTNLSPGDYNLRVIGSNNDGVWNENGASLFIEVTPPWWRTNIAYTIYGIIFIGILLAIRKFETDRREQKAHMRETELRMKATEAEKRAIEIENERKTKELEEARQLQLSMLPKEVPDLPNLDIAAFMRTATEVGGDYYDFIVQKNGVLNVAFGDATGHGLQAGTMVTLMKGFFTSDAAKLELQEFMNHCTSIIKEIKLGRILMSFSLLRFENSKLVITSAGMPPIYYYSKKTEDIEEILIEGMPLGAMRKFSYKVIEKEVKSGDIILLLTDGLPEQMNDNEKMYDYPRVKDHFKQIVNYNPNQIIESFVKSGDEWMGETIQEDDISFVVIKVK